MLLSVCIAYMIKYTKEENKKNKIQIEALILPFCLPVQAMQWIKLSIPTSSNCSSLPNTTASCSSASQSYRNCKFLYLTFLIPRNFSLPTPPCKFPFTFQNPTQVTSVKCSLTPSLLLSLPLFSPAELYPPHSITLAGFNIDLLLLDQEFLEHKNYVLFTFVHPYLEPNLE